MRTTLDIDPDVLAACKDIARQKNVSLGKIVSQRLREAFMRAPNAGKDSEVLAGGFRPFRSRGKLVTNSAVDSLRDNEGV